MKKHHRLKHVHMIVMVSVLLAVLLVPPGALNAWKRALAELERQPGP